MIYLKLERDPQDSAPDVYVVSRHCPLTDCRRSGVPPSRLDAPSAQALRDAELLAEMRVHRANLGIYGVEKGWRRLSRAGIVVGRDRVGRPVAYGLRGNIDWTDKDRVGRLITEETPSRVAGDSPFQTR